jgi:hypothetical protein
VTPKPGRPGATGRRRGSLPSAGSAGRGPSPATFNSRVTCASGAVPGPGGHSCRAGRRPRHSSSSIRRRLASAVDLEGGIGAAGAPRLAAALQIGQGPRPAGGGLRPRLPVVAGPESAADPDARADPDGCRPDHRLHGAGARGATPLALAHQRVRPAQLVSGPVRFRNDHRALQLGGFTPLLHTTYPFPFAGHPPCPRPS